MLKSGSTGNFSKKPKRIRRYDPRINWCSAMCITILILFGGKHQRKSGLPTNTSSGANPVPQLASP